MRILVVEDEKISRTYLQKIAGMYGECDIAEDGAVADEKIRRAFENDDRYDLVFLDIMLPKLTGHSILQLIRAYEKDYGTEPNERTAVVITSAMRDSENVKKAYDNMADEYIVKPLFKNKIEEVIEKFRK